MVLKNLLVNLVLRLMAFVVLAAIMLLIEVVLAFVILLILLLASIAVLLPLAAFIIPVSAVSGDDEISSVSMNPLKTPKKQKVTR